VKLLNQMVLSSMGSVCSGSMALMDAGIPLKKPVAGVAMGLLKKVMNFKSLQIF
jgi:polyribonucleotide nucleotidyltransferase